MNTPSEKNLSSENLVKKTKRIKKDSKAPNIKGKKKDRQVRLSKRKYSEKIVQVKRVTKVVKGGKILTFRAVIILGDAKGKVGVGVGRADDVNLAIDKAVLNAKKTLLNVPLTTNYSLPHVVNSSFGACSLMLRPASQGTGVIAGGSIRTVLELAGIKNVLAKQFGAKNILNNAKATMLALSMLNKKVELGKYQTPRKEKLYKKIMKEYNKF